MKLSVVILNWNGRKHLEKFLPSVTAHSASEGIEVVVADNNSADDSVQFVANVFPGVGLLTFDSNYGYAGGYNRVAGAVGAEYVMMLNSDVEVTPGWLDPLVALMDARPDVAAVMPKIRSYADRSMFEYAGASGGFIDRLGFPFCRGRILSECEKDNGQYDDPREIFWASGAALLVRRRDFLDCGGFDEDFFAHMEEIDLCWRLRSSGRRVMVEPSSVVYHVGGGTLEAGSPRKTYLNYRNNIAMLVKNLSGLSLAPVLLCRVCADTASAFVYLVKGRPRLAGVVFKAYGSVARHLGLWLRKRRTVQRARKRSPGAIYNGSIVLRFFLGKRTFGKLL